MARRRKQRRGVLLLVVLSILVLFVLSGMTFILVAGHYHRGAINFSRRELTGDPPSNLADRAIYQLLRGTLNPVSSIGEEHCLLADLYGEDGFTGLVVDLDGVAYKSTEGQLLGMQFDVVSFVDLRADVPRPADYYNGAVITMVNGAAKGLSARIVRSSEIAGLGSTDGARLISETFLSDQNQIVLPGPGDRFVVNGVPFNGTGFGYNPLSGQLDMMDQGRDASGGGTTLIGPVALLPHFKAYAKSNVVFDLGMGVDSGGADESYDAVDMQNMFLAKLPAAATFSQQITPSFHRPYLLNYWIEQLRAEHGDAIPPQLIEQYLRRVVMRPSPLDHPNFTGSNPAFLPMNPNDPQWVIQTLIPLLRDGPWDVDNDGDGVPDSVWLDLGLPVSTAPDGRLYRPLFAILCTDLDGRVNLNVHGNTAQLFPEYLDAVRSDGMLSATVNSVQVPRGLGLGPAEVNPGAVVLRAEYEALLASRYSDKFGTETVPLPGRPDSQVPDELSQIKNAGVPPDYNAELAIASTNPALLHAFGSPPDLFGRGAVMMDHGGQPVFVAMGLPNETADDPYELNVLNPSGMDSPFTLSELERVLRFGDIDSPLLPTRLLRLAPQTLTGPEAWRNRRLVTTHSFHVPVASVQLPPELRDQPGSMPTIREWMRRRLAANGVADIERHLQLMLPFELRHGQKLDINRVWDNTNGIWGNAQDPTRDEYGRPGISQQKMESGMGMLTAAAAAMPTDYFNDELPPSGRYALTRQLFARHLYCLAMTLLPRGYDDPGTRLDKIPPGSLQSKRLTARRIAQWAVNVVDFRDSDSIMTPFEYDWDPMNGWQVDGDISTNDGGERDIIWGCEYPHLVLSETLAFHDTRLKDSSRDNAEPPEYRTKRDENGDGTSNPEDPDFEDTDLDQYRIPQGSFFAELYCTFDANNRRPDDPATPGNDATTTRVPPPELYQLDPRDNLWKLDLARMPLEKRRDGGVYPVWRLAISEPHAAADSVQSKLLAEPETTTLQPEEMNYFDRDEKVEIDRVVWFTPQKPFTPDDVRGPISRETFEFDKIFWNYYPPRGMPALLAGKQYAVVGPRTETFLGSAKSRNRAGSEGSLRAIKLALGGPGGNTFGVTPAYPPDVQRPIGIVAAMDPPATWRNSADTAPEGIGVNVSEPLPDRLPTSTKYYPEPTHRIEGYPSADAYGIPENETGRRLDGAAGGSDSLEDTPMDADPDHLDRPITVLGLAEGTRPNHRSVFLQRLANPLRAWNPPPGLDEQSQYHDRERPINPYITVDWMPLDLTVFNGEERVRGPADWDHWYWAGARDEDRGEDIDFATRERGAANPPPNILSWTIRDPLPKTVVDANDNDNYFRHNLLHTLGFLNTTYGPRRTDPGHYLGDPQLGPFPWLTWNDRPYANHFELMLVPTSSPSRLLIEFTADSAQDLFHGEDRYSGSDFKNVRAPFGHLLNFFHGSLAGRRTSPNLYRLLELVEVPSPFVGTERWYNPSYFVRNPNENAFVAQSQASYSFRPPFNKLSRFRDPGRININTIFDERVWRAVTLGFDGMSDAQFWLKVDWSRRGIYDDPQRTALTNPAQQPLYPTEFPNPFRSAMGADLQFQLVGLADKPDVEATLLRSDPDDLDAAAPEPLFEYDPERFPNDFQIPANVGRNPYFRYQPLRRLANIISSHSNVFAVWVTVGYFEVDPETGRLSQELNVDTGDVKRHRAFYIVDRSIPVAFEPGQTHNVDRAILLRRFIE